jgi:hypothetical protein
MSSPNMDLSFRTYPAFLDKSLADLPFGKLLFFQVWVTERLYQQFGEELNARFLEEEGVDLKEVLEYLWHMVDQMNKEGKNDLPGEMSLMDKELLAKYLDALKNESIGNELDENETNECGMANLLNSFYNALSFISKKETRYVAEAALYPLNVVDCILANNYGLDTRDPDSHINHPLFQAEFTAQTSLLDYLHSDKAAGKDKRDLFRLSPPL